MKNYQTLLGLGVIVVLTFALISCGKPPTNKPAVFNDTKVERFQINEKEISNVTIYKGPTTHTVSGVIKLAEDIKKLADVLNSATAPVGAATADYYRLLKINMKDGSVVSLEFGGNGRFFKVLESGVFFKLEPEDNHKELNKLIDRIEKEYAN